MLATEQTARRCGGLAARTRRRANYDPDRPAACADDPIKLRGAAMSRPDEKAMFKSSLTDVALTAIERPRCDRCSSRMILARAAPLPNGSEKRMFECPKCHFMETRTVADPIKSDAVERLTSHVKPPV